LTNINHSHSSTGSLPWGQLLMVGIPGTTVDAQARHLIGELQVGGIILFRRNLENPQQVASLTRELQELARVRTGRHLLIAIDQEGGPVQRLQPPFTQMPAAREWGQQDDPWAVELLTAKVGRELRLVGINMNLAPVLDVARGPESPQWERSYGSDPEKVARLGLAAIRGFLAGGVIPVAKHFPGLGYTTLDSHQDTPTVRGAGQERQRDLFPFRQAVAAGVPAIMTAHALVPEWDDRPATLSKKILTDQLRGNLGYQGLITTDDLEMGGICRHWSVAEAALQSLEAGADLLLICEQPEAIAQAHNALARSRSLRARLHESLERIQRLKHRFPHTPVDLKAVQAHFGSTGKKIDQVRN